MPIAIEIEVAQLRAAMPRSVRRGVQAGEYLSSVRQIFVLTPGCADYRAGISAARRDEMGAMVNDPDRPDEGDPTSRMPPVDPDATRIQGSDATRAQGSDATRIQGSDATRAQGSDATRVHGSDATQVQGSDARAAGDRWSARANVPSPAAAPPAWTETVPEEDPYGGRSWFTPVIVGLVALVIASALAFGVWLIYRETSKGEGTVEPSASPSALPSASPSRTRSASPSPTPSASQVAEVTIPSLRNDTEQAATARLRQLGLTVVIQRRSDPTVEPGRVIDTNPGAGSSVPAGSTVTLIVSSAPSPAPSKTSKPPSPAASKN
jgi:hypothetical protein